MYPEPVPIVQRKAVRTGPGPGERQYRERLNEAFFKKAYLFRPGFLQPSKGLKNTLKMYRYLGWLQPTNIKYFFRNYISSLRELGLAMIHVAERGYEKQILEVKDIKFLAKE